MLKITYIPCTVIMEYVVFCSCFPITATIQRRDINEIELGKIMMIAYNCY